MAKHQYPRVEGNESEMGLDKNFGFSKHFLNHYELGEAVGRGHFGYTCSDKAKKGSMKGQDVAVKVIPKSKMSTAIAIEDVRREVQILQALTGHKNLVQFYDAYEDDNSVYIVMEENEQELSNAMGSMYVAVLFIGIANASAVQPVVSIERIVSCRERVAGLYSALAFAFAQVAIEFSYVFAQTIIVK